MIHENHCAALGPQTSPLFTFSVTLPLPTHTHQATMASFARVSTPVRRTTSRGGPVRVVAKGDGARVDRSSKNDVM